MKTKKILMTVSFLTLMAVSVPAMAESDVLCSVRSNVKGAEYVPGVDVNGKAVVGADVGAPAVPVSKSLTIPLSMDMAKHMNAVLPEGGKLDAQIGLVQIQQDGKVMINGQDMTGPVDAACVTLEKQKAAALKTKDAPKKKKAAPKVAEEMPKVEAVPAPAAEIIAPEPVVEATPEPTAEQIPSAPEPQVLEAQPPELPAPPAAPSAEVVPQPVPMEAPALAPPPTAPGTVGIPTPPPSGAIVPPTEAPRPPMDPLAPAPVPPAPAPAQDGTLSGGAQ